MICRLKGKNSVVIFVIVYNRGLMGDFTQLIHIKSPVLYWPSSSLRSWRDFGFWRWILAAEPPFPRHSRAIPAPFFSRPARPFADKRTRVRNRFGTRSRQLRRLVIILPVGIIKHVTKTGSKEDGPFLFLERIYAYRRF